jgi:hydroxymethylpyrimidine kinase/phosphomethylpyrimidine kinase/thiamine-phosphate diphosphorylase
MTEPTLPSHDPRRPVVWTISGSDSGGGAGIQADTRALDAFGVHAACAIATITAQNSRAVARVAPVAPELLHAQLAALADDMPPDAIKTGLLGSVGNVRVVVEWVTRLRARHAPRAIALVVDPVFGASTGAPFADAALRQAYRDELLPLATLATPNLGEARALAGLPHDADAAALAQAWRGFGVHAVVITGGDVDATRPDAQWAGDWLDSAHRVACRGWLVGARVSTPHGHGTGCVFASSAAAALALGFHAADAVALAKMATREGLRHAYAAGAGAGPVAPRAGFATRIDHLPTLGPSPGGPPARAFPAMPEHSRGLYAIVDSADWVRRVLAAGVRIVQLRIKDARRDLLAREISLAVALARAAHATLIVNDHWALALALGAHGVHLGQEDLDGVDFDALRAAGLLLGISTHSVAEVCRARALAPSYVACGPIHATTLKAMPWRPQGDANLAYWCRLLAGTPVVAVGGMDVPRARSAMLAGAWAVAVVGAIVRNEQPAAAITDLRAAVAFDSADYRAGSAQGEVPTIPRATLGA